MKKRSLPLTLALTLFMPLAMTNASANELTYEEFVTSCSDPSAFGHQRPPQNIRVVCNNVRTLWEPIESGSETLQETRLIAAQVVSDKYHVSLENFFLEVPELNVLCPKFREIVSTVQIEKALSCEQILGNPQTLEEICTEAIDEALASNPDLADDVPTGRIYSTCSETSQKP